MMLAQQLYEGVELGDEGPTGLITYMRTDSVRVSTEAQASARAFIASIYGKDYVPSARTSLKAKRALRMPTRPYARRAWNTRPSG